MSEPRDEIAEILARTLYEHSAASTFDSTCGTCVREREHARSLSGPLLDWLAERDRRVAGAALRRFADSRGVNVGDEDDDYWRGYRQAQRECLHDAVRVADRIERGER